MFNAGTSLYQTNLLLTELFVFKFLNYFQYVQVYADGPLRVMRVTKHVIYGQNP